MLNEYGHSYTYNSEIRRWKDEGFSYEQWVHLLMVLERYRRFYHYIKEIKPGWKTKKTIHFLDNSIEEIQVDKEGNERTVTVKMAHGDLCF